MKPRARQAVATSSTTRRSAEADASRVAGERIRFRAHSVTCASCGAPPWTACRGRGHAIFEGVRIHLARARELERFGIGSAVRVGSGPKVVTPRRTISLRFTELELELVRQSAARRGTAVSVWMRQIVLEAAEAAARAPERRIAEILSDGAGR